MRNISLPRGQRGIAEIISFMLVFSALFGFTAYVLVVQGRQAGMRASGLIDVMRDAQKRQNQLLSLTYSTHSGTTLEVYLFNYGSQEAIIENLWVNEEQKSYGVFDAITKEPDNLSPGKLVRVDVYGVLPSTDGDNFIFLTESKSLYSWKVG